MIDNLVRFPSKEDCPYPMSDAPAWAVGNRTLMPVEIIIDEGEMDPDWDGPEPLWNKPRIVARGYWLVIRTDERDPSLEAEDTCLIVADQALALAGEPFIYVNKLADDDVLGWVQPTFSGDNYPIFSGPATNLAPFMVA